MLFGGSILAFSFEYQNLMQALEEKPLINQIRFIYSLFFILFANNYWLYVIIYANFDLFIDWLSRYYQEELEGFKELYNIVTAAGVGWKCF